MRDAVTPDALLEKDKRKWAKSVTHNMFHGPVIRLIIQIQILLRAKYRILK